MEGDEVTECHAAVIPPYPSDTSDNSNSYYGEGINNDFSFRDGVAECHAAVTLPYPSENRGQVTAFTMGGGARWKVAR